LSHTLICKTCGEEKPLDAFYRQRTILGRHRSCVECVKARVRKYRAENIERVRDYDRQRGQLPERKAANRIRAKGRNDASRKHWAERNKERRTAHITVNNALKKGRLVRPKTCERCGQEKRLHGHHEDYSKPMVVNWLCHDCHGERHREINAERREALKMAAE